MKMNRIRKRPPASRDKRPLRFFAFVFIAAAVLPTAVAAQVLPEIPPPSDTVYEVGLADGSSIVGRITEVDPQQVVITTLGGGRLEIGRTQVRTVRVAAGRFVRGEYWHEDPGGTRLFFTATGRTLARGESYIGTYVIFLPFAAVGVTDRFTITAGAPVLAGEFQPFYLGPKLQVYRTPTAQASVGTLAFFFDDEMVGIAYGVGTFGNTDDAFFGGNGLLLFRR